MTNWFMTFLARIFGKKVVGIDIEHFGFTKCTAYKFLGVTYVVDFEFNGK